MQQTQSSPKTTTVYLRANETTRVLAGHPWIYPKSIDRLTGDPVDGELVQVKDSKRRFLGMGFYNSQSKIRVRLATRQKEDIDAAFFVRRLTACLRERERYFPGARTYRLVNAESDFLSGLIIDRYEDHAVVQISSLGMEQRKDCVMAALRRVLNPKRVVERRDMAARKMEGLEVSDPIDSQEGDSAPELATVPLNGLLYSVDLIKGHKTGTYLDQRQNYAAAAQYAKGKNVLDCFTFNGGFALHAAQAGARRVTAIDQSEEAIEGARANAKNNRLDENCEFICANVFDWLRERTRPSTEGGQTEGYDLIILDPPSFTRNRRSIPEALRGYKEIHLRALKLLNSEGVLATFCCSHHVDAELFESTVLSAALDLRVRLKRIARYSHPPDHPIVPAIPETEYLKGFAYTRYE